MGDAGERGQDGEPLLPILAEQIRRLGSILDQTLRMGKTANLRLEFFVLAHRQLCLGNLLLLPAQQLQTLADILNLLRTLLSEARLFLPVRIDLCIRRKTRTKIAVSALKQIALCVLTQKGKVLVLPVDIHEIRSDFF